VQDASRQDHKETRNEKLLLRISRDHARSTDHAGAPAAGARFAIRYGDARHLRGHCLRSERTQGPQRLDIGSRQEWHAAEGRNFARTGRLRGIGSPQGPGWEAFRRAGARHRDSRDRGARLGRQLARYEYRNPSRNEEEGRIDRGRRRETGFPLCRPRGVFGRCGRRGAHVTVVAMASSAVPDERSGRKKILLVGRDSSLQHTRRLILERAGYEVVHLTNTEAALNRFTSGEFNLVLLGSLMSEAGKELLAREIKRIRPLTPVVNFAEGIAQRNEDVRLEALSGPDRLLSTVGRLVMKNHGHPEIGSKYYAYVDQIGRAHV